MKPLRPLLYASLLAVGMIGAACSGGNDDDDREVDDPGDTGRSTPTPPAGPSTPFAAFVIDLIENQTADDTEPVAVDFDSADDENPDAFDTLFD